MYKLGIDIGGTKVNLGLLDQNNNIVLRHTEKITGSRDYKSVIKRIKESLDELLPQNGISYGEIVSCGMGVPGTVSDDGRVAVKIPNLGWVDACIADEFEGLTGISAKLVQGSRAAAWGECMAGSGQGKQIVVCVTLGTGIGTGIVINGEIFNGALGGAGEMGHTPLVPGGRECGCGKRGCLEKYAAGLGLAITTKEMFGPDAPPDTLFIKAKEGDKQSILVLENAVMALGNAMVSIINLLSPDCLLFSGGMSKQQEFFMDPLIEYVKTHCYSVPSRTPHIGMAALGEDSPMVGAALLK